MLPSRPAERRLFYHRDHRVSRLGREMQATKPKTGCECTEPGFCKRHGVEKPAHFVRLCQTRPSYFNAWEEGKGPRQQHDAMPKFPSLPKQVWNLAKSLAAFVSDGCKTLPRGDYEARLKICDQCGFREGGRCIKCGCNLALKARGRAFACPESKWPDPRR